MESITVGANFHATHLGKIFGTFLNQSEATAFVNDYHPSVAQALTPQQFSHLLTRGQAEAGAAFIGDTDHGYLYDTETVDDFERAMCSGLLK